MPVGERDTDTWRQWRTSFGSVAAGYAAHRPDYAADAVAFLMGRVRGACSTWAPAPACSPASCWRPDMRWSPSNRPSRCSPSCTPATRRWPRTSATRRPSRCPTAASTASSPARPPTGSTPSPRRCSCGGCSARAASSAWCGTPATRRSPGWLRSAGRWPTRGAATRPTSASSTPSPARWAPRSKHHRSGIVQRLSPEQVVAGIATRSYVATMDDARREAFLGEVRAVLDTHPDTRGRDVVDLPYRTDAYKLTPG